jgi:pantoate--beta-alanine ligase
MQDTAAQLRAGVALSATLTAGATRITEAGFALDYFEARHAETLQPIESLKDGPVRLLVAAKIGTTRLIDNIGV